MSLKYIRQHYKVPAKRGMRVRFHGKVGRITGAFNAYLHVRFDGEKFRTTLHPTYEVEYLDQIIKET